MLLSREFNKAAASLKEEMRDFEAQEKSRSIRKAIEKLPLFAFKPWVTPFYNCYNFALDNQSRHFAYPGDFSARASRLDSEGPFEEFHKTLHKGALRDGLEFLGEHFSAAAGRDATPVALFLRDENRGFHWYALRRQGPDALWAHKAGRTSPEILYQNDSIFANAQAHDYYYFAGYYAVPDALRTMPR
ncbi:MAG: hypothetical protein HYU57_01725 [Micavibrio aeruginosavorus]|nr:hypothetical protein [Micavibrio aeruginosavorus]